MISIIVRRVVIMLKLMNWNYNMDRLTMNSEWFDSVLKRVGFYDPTNPLPKNDLGMTVFLEDRGIKIVYEYFYAGEKIGWIYYGVDIEDNDCFTEDLEYYPDFNVCAQHAIMECMCYLLTKNKTIN